MYKKIKPNQTSIKINTSYSGETIEQKIQRITNNKEPISDGAPLIYTDRKNGVEPAYDIRTDRWEVALDAMDKISKTHTAKREERIGEKTYDTMNETEQTEFNKKYPNNKHNKKTNTEGEPIQGTEQK